MRWRRESRRGYLYEYQRRRFKPKIIYHFDASDQISLSFDYDHKQERKQIFNSLEKTAISQQSLDRQSLQSEINYQYLLSEDILNQTAFVVHNREAKYDPVYKEDQSTTLEDPIFSPTTTRREWNLYHLSNFPTSESRKSFFQTGFFLSKARLKKKSILFEESRIFVESKAQTAWEYWFHKNGTVVLGANWNLDRLVNEYPYGEDLVNPWNGGSIQFQFVF